MLESNPFHSNELGQLYHEIILDHSRCPRGKKKPENCRLCQDGKNPLCGDQVTVFVTLNQKVENALPKISVFFEGLGCSISQASTSIMCSLLENVTVAKAREWIHESEEIYSGKKVVDEDDFEVDLEALGGVSQFPVRVKCAALPWKTLEILLNDNFDEQGFLKADLKQENAYPTCSFVKKLKVVSTE